METNRKWNVALLGLGAGAVLFALGCGGGGGGGSGGGSSTITGNVSNAETAAAETRERSWLAWVRDEVVGFARNAWAQGNREGISVTARRGGRSASDVTDGAGGFAIPGAPTNDVTVNFSRGNCSADVVVPDVASNSTIALEDVEFECTSARPGKISEIFLGVVRRKPGSPQGNLVVCADMGDRHQTRAVMLRNADFVSCSEECTGEGDEQECETVCDERGFDEVAVGDLVEATGQRVGQGAPSAHDADTVEILDVDQPDFCTDDDGEPDEV